MTTMDCFLVSLALDVKLALDQRALLNYAQQFLRLISV